MHRKVPVYLEPTKDRRIVVFGGGAVALRKCRQFEGFRITVVAESTVPGTEEACDELILKRLSPSEIADYLKDAFLAVAATDDKTLNSAIVASAKGLGVPVNSAHGGGDVLLPSVVRKEHYSVAVSSEGSVPAFPPYVAKRIDEFLGPEYDLMMEVLMHIRKDLKESVSQQPKRAELLAEILSNEDIWNMLRNGGLEEAVSAAEDIESRYIDR